MRAFTMFQTHQEQLVTSMTVHDFMVLVISYYHSITHGVDGLDHLHMQCFN